ncbi:MAG: HEAT repeat domain-containing protein [Verrucomicrobiia bacterium]
MKRATPILRPDGSEIVPKFGPNAVPWILKYVSNSKESGFHSPLNECKRVVRGMLARVAGDRDQIKERLIMGFHDADPQVRLNALLGMIPPFLTGEEVQPLIRTALKDPDRRVRAAAVSAWIPFNAKEGGSHWPHSLYPFSPSEAATNLIRQTGK